MCWRHPWGKETSWQVGSWVLASSRRNVCKCHVIWLILVSWGSCCFTKQMISRPGCKAFEYVKKNGLSRFLQKSQTQHRPRPPESGIRNPPDLTLGESWLGNGSIPINTIFRGMNIHLPAILMFTRGTRFWHTPTSKKPAITNHSMAPRRTIPVGTSKAGSWCSGRDDVLISPRCTLQVPVADVLSPGFQAVLSVKDSVSSDDTWL